VSYRTKEPNWGQTIGEDWNVSSVNTIPVLIRKIFGIFLVGTVKIFKTH
jgi:hypothetical protein